MQGPLNHSVPGPEPLDGGRAPRPNRPRSLLTAPRDRPLLLAHRGDSSHAPENTLEAALLGWQGGADAWEFDVQLTRDGVPVVIHDNSLLRTTDVTHRFGGDERAGLGFLVAHFDLAEIRSLDAGSWFLDPAGGVRSARHFGTYDAIPDDIHRKVSSRSVRVPTLHEALELTARFDWLANIELKSFPGDDLQLCSATLDAIDAVGVPERVLISSFNHNHVARIARMRPDIGTGVLTATPLERPVEYVRESVRADFYHPSTLALGAGSADYLRDPSVRHLRGSEIRQLREQGVPVLVYTVNDARPDGLGVHLVKAGVSGLFTDDPSALRRLWPSAPAG